MQDPCVRLSTNKTASCPELAGTFPTLSVSYLIKIKVKEGGSSRSGQTPPPFTSNLTLLPLCSSFAEGSFFFLTTKKCTLLLGGWFSFVFHPFYVAFIEITEIPQMPPLEPT